MEASGANIFVTSRPYPEDIQESFKGVPKIKILAKEGDIKTYIEQKIGKNGRAKRLIQRAQCQDEIISEVIHCADGV